VPWRIFLNQVRTIGRTIGVHTLAYNFWEDLVPRRLVEMQDVSESSKEE
jgi:hypothetical protein